uniref:Uncharacterized protein n=1 Tax=Arion vulgaris TaxID=1028688 RepID=A0A0B7ABW5_9EUPU
MGMPEPPPFSSDINNHGFMPHQYLQVCVCHSIIPAQYENPSKTLSGKYSDEMIYKFSKLN